MRTTRVETKVVEEEITTYTCDFCDYSTERNQGCCGVQPIMSCSICEQDVCPDHRHWFSDDHWSDYPDGFYACPDCQPLAQELWDNAEYEERMWTVPELMREELKEDRRNTC